MEKFDDLVALLTSGNTEEIGDFAEFSKKLEASHAHELSVRDAKVQQMTEAVTERDKAIAELKITNYDLIQRVPSTSKDDSKDGDGNGSNQDSDKIDGVSSLFG